MKAERFENFKITNFWKKLNVASLEYHEYAF